MSPCFRSAFTDSDDEQRTWRAWIFVMDIFKGIRLGVGVVVVVGGRDGGQKEKSRKEERIYSTRFPTPIICTCATRTGTNDLGPRRKRGLGDAFILFLLLRATSFTFSLFPESLPVPYHVHNSPKKIESRAYQDFLRFKASSYCTVHTISLCIGVE